MLHVERCAGRRDMGGVCLGRSLRQMKQDLKAAGVTKLAGLAGAPSETTSTACAGAVCGSVAAGAEEASSELCDALGSLHIAGPQVS